MLVVDPDGEPLAPLRALEDILLCLGTWEDDDRRDPGTDTEPLPAPLADPAALAAVQRLLTALAPTQSRGSGRGRLLAPDGRYEHAPITALTLPAAGINLLSATAAALGHPRLNADIAELVDAHAEQLAGGYRRADRTELVSLLARLAGLLGLAATYDTRLLTAGLRATPPGADCVLSDAEEAAHARTADRMNHIWAHGSGIDRYLYWTRGRPGRRWYRVSSLDRHFDESARVVAPPRRARGRQTAWLAVRPNPRGARRHTRPVPGGMGGADGRYKRAPRSNLEDLVAQCPRSPSPRRTAAARRVDYAALDVPDVGDSSEAVTAALALTGPDGTNATLISLLPVAVDGDRLLFLQQVGPASTPPDPAAFTPLFEDAFEAQRDV